MSGEEVVRRGYSKPAYARGQCVGWKEHSRVRDDNKIQGKKERGFGTRGSNHELVAMDSKP